MLEINAFSFKQTNPLGDPGSQKLRMVSWNLNTLAVLFRWLYTPRSSSDKVSQDPYREWMTSIDLAKCCGKILEKETMENKSGEVVGKTNNPINQWDTPHRWGYRELTEQ